MVNSIRNKRKEKNIEKIWIFYDSQNIETLEEEKIQEIKNGTKQYTKNVLNKGIKKADFTEELNKKNEELIIKSISSKVKSIHSNFEELEEYITIIGQYTQSIEDARDPLYDKTLKFSKHLLLETEEWYGENYKKIKSFIFLIAKKIGQVKRDTEKLCTEDTLESKLFYNDSLDELLDNALWKILEFQNLIKLFKWEIEGERF